MLVLYYQIKRILLGFTKNEKKKMVCFFSIIPVIMSVIFAFSGTYYIDNFGLIFLDLLVNFLEK